MSNRLEFYTDEQLGTHQSMTPEGFLLVTDVPIARTGIMKYADGEVPVSAGNDGIIYISRDPDQVFAPQAISSFNGKPVTDEHPPEKVTPENWKRYAIGDVINPRRGDGVKLDNDFLYADLLIKDADAIAAVRAGKREVSAGYDAEYEELAPGQGRQKDIIGNHVALVDKGRCGPRCAIGDSAMPLTSALRNRIIRAITADADLVQELEKVPEMLGSADAASTDQNGHHVTINVHGGKPSTDADEDEGSNGGGSGNDDILARLDALEAAVAALAQKGGEGGGSQDRRTRDRGRGRSRDADRDDDGDDDDDRRDRSDDRRTRDRRTRDELMGSQSNWPSEGGNIDDIESRSPDRGSMASRPPKESATDRRMRDADEDRDDDKDDDDDDRRDRSDDRRTRDRRGTRDRRTTRDHMTGDSQSLAEAWRETMALGEILAPGISLPTFDSKQAPRFTMDALCAFRRKALAQGYRDGDTRQVINDMLGPNGKPDFNNMTCDAIAPLFAGAAQIMRRHNAMVSGQSSRTARVAAPYQPPSPADINARNRQRYGYA